jgi:hypothetical protein
MSRSRLSSLLEMWEEEPTTLSPRWDVGPTPLSPRRGEGPTTLSGPSPRSPRWEEGVGMGGPRRLEGETSLEELWEERLFSKWSRSLMFFLMDCCVFEVVVVEYSYRLQVQKKTAVFLDNNQKF